MAKKNIHPVAAKLGYKSNEDFYNDYPTQDDYEMKFGGKVKRADGGMTAPGFIGPKPYNPADYPAYEEPRTGSVPQRDPAFDPSTNPFVSNGSVPGPIPNSNPVDPTRGPTPWQTAKPVTPSLADNRFNNTNAHSGQPMPLSEPKHVWREDGTPINLDVRGHADTANLYAGTFGVASAALKDLHHRSNNIGAPTLGEQRDAYGVKGSGATFAYGGELNNPANGVVMTGRGKMVPMSDAPNPMYKFIGPSHDDNGISLEYGGQKAEVQGGETASIDGNKALQVHGAITMPNLGEMTAGLQGKKLEKIGLGIGKAENSAMTMLKKASTISDTVNPRNPFDQYAANSAIALNSGGNINLKATQVQKMHLEDIGENMRAIAEMNGVDNKDAHKLIGKNGLTIKAEGGVTAPATAPTTYKYDKKGGRAFDMEKANKLGYHGDADTKKFQQFLLENYPEQVAKAGVGTKSKKWMDGTWGKRTDQIIANAEAPNNVPALPNLEQVNAEPRQATPAMQKLGPVELNNLADNPTRPQNIYPKGDQPIRHYNSLADMNKLHAMDFLPAAKYLLDTPDPVPTGQVNPSLKSPYQVSFQDRVNANQSTFNQMAKQVPNDYAALSSLAAQKYDADNGVLGEEFRTNQGIASQVSNDNTGIMNDAQKMNTQLNMDQLAKQSQAKSNTEAHKAQSLAWISDKVAKNRLENINIQMDEMRYGYRPYTDENGHTQLEYKGPNAYLAGSQGGYASNAGTKVVRKFDADHTLTGYEETSNTPSADDDISTKRTRVGKWGGMFPDKKKKGKC